MNNGVALEPAQRWWECPNCDQTAVTRELIVGNHYHNCKGRFGLSVPMVPAGTARRD